ncbi:MAG: hypothetical protein AAFR38_04570 [Planctomycetota bacterium]
MAQFQSDLGPLEPPAGPVSNTQPDLATLEANLTARIDALTVQVSEPVEFEVFNAPLFGPLSDNLQAALVWPGRVYVKSMTTYFSRASVFDGPGQIDGNARPIQGQIRGRSNAVYAADGGSVTTEFGFVVENGLYVAWDQSNSDNGFVTVIYRPLPPAN